MRQTYGAAVARAARMAITAGAIGIFAVSALADPISFDPDGGGPDGAISVSTFDYQPGNGIFVGLGPAASPKVNQPFTYLYQAQIGNLLDAGSNVISVPGFNQPGGFELTAIFEFQGVANGAGGLNPTVYTLAPGASQFTMFYDANPLTQANALAGTGFDDGSTILGGQITQADGSYSIIPANPLPLFDGSGVDNYGGFTSLVSAGGADYTVGSLAVDTNFFLTAPPVLKLHMLNSSNVTPFDQVDPSRVFQPLFANYSPNLPPANGQGTDFQVQADAVGSFSVPEPNAFALLALAGAILLVLRKRLV